MKKNILIGIAFLCIMVIDAIPSYSSIQYLQSKSKIELKGSLYESTPRSVFSPIEAFISISQLRANFLADLGDIEVVIYDDSWNIVYERSVNTPGENQITIDISTWEEGNYTIRFINSEDRFMYGEFEIRPF
jgi:hypothetical protein